MPTLADRHDLAPRARQLLAAQSSECGALLQPLVGEALDDLDQELFRVAEKSSGGQLQHEALEAIRQLKHARDAFAARVLALLDERLATFGAPAATAAPAQTARGERDLSLVDPREFDESIAQDDLSSRTELHAGNALFDLYLRYAVLIAAPPLDAEALPCGPHALARIFGEALEVLGLYPSQRLLFYRLCERRLSAAAESMYMRLSESLKAGGVLPHLRSYLPRRARPQTRPASQGSKPEPAPSPLGAVTEYSPAAAPGNDAPPAMPELHDLLGARRATLAKWAPAGAAKVDGQRSASAGELDAALAALQARPAPAPGPHPSERLQRDLLAELRRANPGQAPAMVAGEQRDAMELITLLYDQMFAETHADGCAWQLLAGLQVPLTRVAMADSNFFTTHAHPARRLLNTVLETANLWLDRSDGQFDSSLHQRLQRSVQRIASEFQGDLGVIEREADGLESHVRQLKRRAEIAERRQVEAAQGRDRLREARKTAASAVAIRMAHAQPSPLVRALLEHAWVDVLTLTLLRDGERSDGWRKRLAATDKLLGPAVARNDEALAAELHGGLMQVGLQASEAEQLISHALERPAPASASGTPPTQTELLVRLKSRRAAAEPDTPTTAPAVAEKVPLSVAEREALTRLKALPFGAWIEFTINQQGQKVARKLAWQNPISGRCLLVNARGVAGPEQTLEQVARLMARGMAQPLPQQADGPLDRIWGALVSGLRSFVRPNVPAKVAT